MNQSVVVESSETTAIKPKTKFTGKVVKIGLAGALVDIGVGKPALLHISQIVSPDKAPIKRVEDVLKDGQEIDVWVKKVSKKDGEERIELTMLQPLALEWKDIKAGMNIKGNVVRLEKFGAFVEIGAERPGLVHISEMAYGYIQQPSDVVKEGDEIEAQIIDFDRKKKQIKLSMKALLPEPEKVEPAPRQEPRREKTAAGPKGNKKKAPRRGSSDYSGDFSEMTFSSSEESEKEPTSMEIALRAAMEKAQDRKKVQEEKRKAKAGSQEQEEILSRTLVNKPSN